MIKTHHYFEGGRREGWEFASQAMNDTHLFLVSFSRVPLSPSVLVVDLPFGLFPSLL